MKEAKVMEVGRWAVCILFGRDVYIVALAKPKVNLTKQQHIGVEKQRHRPCKKKIKKTLASRKYREKRTAARTESTIFWMKLSRVNLKSRYISRSKTQKNSQDLEKERVQEL